MMPLDDAQIIICAYKSPQLQSARRQQPFASQLLYRHAAMRASEMHSWGAIADTASIGRCTNAMPFLGRCLLSMR